MYYKIEKSLGRPVAIQVDSIPEKGICVDVKNFRSKDISMIIYQDGKLNDIQMNNWTFPYVYNEIGSNTHHSPDYDDYCRVDSIRYIDPTGNNEKSTYPLWLGNTEAQSAENLIYELYRLSCCENFDQYINLRVLYFKTTGFHDYDCEMAKKIVDFVDSFSPHLSNLKDTEYLEEVINEFKRVYNSAKEYLSPSDK